MIENTLADVRSLNSLFQENITNLLDLNCYVIVY